MESKPTGKIDITNRRKKGILPWVLVIFVLASCAILSVWVICEKKQNESFISRMINKEGTSLLEIRLKSIELKGDESFVNSSVFVKIWGTCELENVCVEIKDRRHFIGRYNLTGKYDRINRVYEGRRELSLYPERGSLLSYPFDTLVFNFSMELDPQKTIKEIHFYDGITDFFIDKLYVDNGRMTFELKRKFYGKAFFFVLVPILLIYVIVIILSVRKIDLLVTSLVTFFISIWSIRTVVNDFIKGLWTFLDIFLLLFSVLLLSSVLIMIILGYYKTEDKQNDAGKT
jgi:hypothetical protein